MSPFFENPCGPTRFFPAGGVTGRNKFRRDRVFCRVNPVNLEKSEV